MKKFFSEFKAFAMKGNVIDLAVGVIIGGAFGKIVSSLVNDLLMPIIGYFTGGINFSEHRWVIQPEVVDNVTKDVITPEIALTWGAFVQATVDFLIVAFCIFCIIKFIMSWKKKDEEAPAPAEPSDEVKLLTEIRDLLKKNQQS